MDTVGLLVDVPADAEDRPPKAEDTTPEADILPDIEEGIPADTENMPAGKLMEKNLAKASFLAVTVIEGPRLSTGWLTNGVFFAILAFLAKDL